MASLRNLMIRLGIDYDQTGVNRLSKGLDNVASRVTKTAGTLDKLRLPAAAAGFASMAGAASSFAVALAPAAASVIAMPAAFAGAKVATATLKLGLLGVGDAMSAVAEGDAKKLNEALKDLSPNAQQFVRSSAGFMKSFDPIKSAVQDKLFEGLGKSITPVSNNLLPGVRRGLLGVAGGFNTGTKEAVKFASSPVAKGTVSAVFKGLTGTMKEAATGVRPFLELVSKLVVLGIPLAQRMASWAINGVKAGAAFATSEKGARTLSGWAQKAGDVLASLGRIGKNLGTGLFNTFSQANANTTDFLGNLEKLTAKFAAWSKSAEGQQQAANVFKLLGDVAKQLTQILPLLIGPLGAIAKLISTMPPEVQGTVTTFLAFGVVAGALGGKLAVLGGVLFKGASTAVQFAGGLVKGSSALANNATFAAKAGGALRGAASAISTGIVNSAKMVATLSAQAGAWLLTTTRTVAYKVASIAANVASKALAVGIRLVNLAMKANPIGLLVTLILGLIAVVVTLYKKNETFRKIVDAVWKGIKSAIQSAIDNVIKPVITWLYNFISGTLAPKFLWLYANIIRPTMSRIGDVVRTVIDKVKGYFTFLKTLITETVPNAFRTGVSAIGRFWDKLKDVAKKPVSFLVNTVYNKGIATVWNWVADKTGLSRINYIQGFARGGVLSGFSRKDDQLIMARSGEGILVPEAVKALGSKFIHQTNAAARNGGARNVGKLLAGDPGGLGIPGFEQGGIVGFVKGFFGKAKDFFVNGFIKAATAALNPMIQVARNAIGQTPFGRLLVGAVEKIVGGALNAFKPYESELGGGGGMKAVHAARSQIGVPYSWGGGGPSGPSRGFGRGANTTGFDCSSLMQYAWFKATGKVIPRTTYTQRPYLKKITEPRPGAIGQPHADHTYMFSGNNKIIEAPFTGGRVREVPKRHTPFWGWPPFSFDNGGVMEPGMTGVNQTREPEYVFTRKQMNSGFAPAIEVHVHVDPVTGKTTYELLKKYKKQNGGKKLDL